MFLEISQNSQENTCARVSFLKRRLRHRCFSVNFEKFLGTLFLQNTSGGWCCKHFRRKLHLRYLARFWISIKVSRLVLMCSLWTLIWTSKCQKKIKIPLWQISMETNHVDKRTSEFEFLNCDWSISSKFAEKNWKIFTQGIHS